MGLLLLVDGPLREVVALRLEVERAEGLLVLGQVLPQHIPQSLGLLRAEENGIVVADGDLVRSVAGGQAEDQLEVPNADADLDAVGVGFAVVGGLDKVHLGLLRGWTHGFSRLLRLVGRVMVRKGGLEPPWIAPPDPKSGASANSATFA